MNLKEKILRFLLKIFYYAKFKFEVNYTDFDPNRKDPYFLIGNHPCLHDGLYTSVHLKKYPFPIINAFMFVNKSMKFLLTKVIHSVPKRKGQNDIITIREMMRIIKTGRGIMLFPEGNSSYYGCQSPIPYSTVKLFKKMKLDIVIAMANGAYLSAPRWALKSERGFIELNFYTLFKSEDIERMTLDEIYEGLKDAIKFNDFDWNRKRKYLFNPKHRAVGLENYIYYCPICKSYQTIYTKGNAVFCDKCGEIAHFNQFSLLEGLDFDNLVEWGRLQKQQVPEIAKDILKSSGILYKVDTLKYTSIKIGEIAIELKDNKLYVVNEKMQLVFELKKIQGLVLTKKNEISFDYDKETYFIKFKDPMLFYDVINYKKGGLT